MRHTRLSPALQQAYRQALYRLDEGWQLQVGMRQPLLLAGYARHGARCASYLTACNPRGRLLSEAENKQRMQRLCLALDGQGWSWTPGFGQDPQGKWPGEASVLVWGMDAPTARRWGQQWQQNAVLFCGAAAVPRLLWLR